jgi:hypothetical protein
MEGGGGGWVLIVHDGFHIQRVASMCAAYEEK